MKANRFAKGSGVYVCASCGRSTRATGRGDNEHVGLCAECYDIAGIENAIADGELTFDECRAEYGHLVEKVREKGGDTSNFEFDEEF